jgi:hypothetical protein
MLAISRQPAVLLAFGGLFCLGIAGCSRNWFRRQADTEAYQAIQEKGGYLDLGSVYPPAESRLHDPYSIDCPPIPKDDPRSAQLMQCVDGMRGYPHWYRNGRIGSVEPVAWLQSLPRNETGDVELDLRGAIDVGRLNSRDFQRSQEILYLSALDVTLERFRFDHQFFSGGIFTQEFRGRLDGGRSTSSLDNFALVRKTGAAGGEFVVGLANSLLWDAWGAGSDTFASTLDFAVRQPLLRFGGRARVLEPLTQTERDLLANVRQMEQFRRGFYVNLATGRTSGSGPSLGSRIGQAGLGVVAGFPSGRNGAPSAGGYMGLLQDQQEIRNQEANVVALRDSAAQLEAAFDANRISSRLQVDQARQALLNAQSSLLASRAAYDSRVDEYKISLGLPPELPVTIRDPLLDRFLLIDPTLTQLQNDVTETLLRIRRGRSNPAEDEMAECLAQLQQLDGETQRQMRLAEASLETLIELIPDRLQQLERVARQVEAFRADVDARVYDRDLFEQRVTFLRDRVPAVVEEIDSALEERAGIAHSLGSEDLEALHKRLVLHATRISDLLLELSLVHAEIKLQGISLLPIDLQAEQALEVARENRLDWMNARANLVDSWRKIEFFANELKSDLDVVVTGELGTRSNDPFSFSTDNGRVRMGLQFDTPTARLAERNRYRESLVNYQQARRDYMLFEDRVSQSLRNTIRIIQLSQINLEVRRAAVAVAIAQVDIARLSLNPPVRPNQPTRTSPTAARDLVSALTDLLNAQNDLLNVWVSYEVLRILIDFEMGTMQLDASGVWIDPGEVDLMERNLMEMSPIELAPMEMGPMDLAPGPIDAGAGPFQGQPTDNQVPLIDASGTGRLQDQGLIE